MLCDRPFYNFAWQKVREIHMAKIREICMAKKKNILINKRDLCSKI